MTALRHIARNVIKGTVLLMTLSLLSLSALAQEPDKRHVTPVKPETNQVKPPPKGTDERIIQQYITGDSTAAMQASPTCHSASTSSSRSSWHSGRATPVPT